MSPVRRRGGSEPASRIARTRVRRACWVVGGLLAMTVLTWALGCVGRPGVLGEAASAVAGEATARGAPDAPALPLGFADEVVAVAGRDEVRADERGRVVGFCVSSAAEGVFSSLADELAGKGWARIESGSATCGSFSKNGGAYRWAFVTCVQVGDSTSVVVQYAAADEGS